MALTQEQIKNRRIGGSSSGTAFGLNPYKRPEQLRRELSYSLLGRDAIREWIQPYLKQEDNVLTEEELIQREIDKMERDIDNKPIRVGTFLEDFVRERLKSEGYQIRKKNKNLVHPDYEYITANVDGHEQDIIEEIKCITIHRKKDFGEEWTDQAAPDYGCQCNHYLLWPQFTRARLRVLFLTESERELIDRMVRGMVLKNVESILSNNSPMKATFDSGESIEFIIPRYGAVMMNTKKLAEYQDGGICSLNLDVVKNIVDIAPLQTYEFTQKEKPEEREKFQQMFYNVYADLWYRARNNIPCVPVSLEDCQILYDGYSSGIKKTATDKEKRLRSEHDILVREIKEKQARLDAIAAECMIEAGPADIVMGPDKKALYRIGQKWSPSKDDGPLIEWMERRSSELGIPEKDILKMYLKQDVIDWDKVKSEIPEVYHRCRIKCARGVQWPRV